MRSRLQAGFARCAHLRGVHQTFPAYILADASDKSCYHTLHALQLLIICATAGHEGRPGVAHSAFVRTQAAQNARVAMKYVQQKTGFETGLKLSALSLYASQQRKTCRSREGKALMQIG